METTKADDIALELEDAIVTGAIAPGVILRQHSLSEQFDVSRTPIREALRLLAALDLVEFIPNRGVRVRALSLDQLRDAFLVRAELEGLAAATAADRITENELEALAEAERRFAQATRLLLDQEGVDRSLRTEWVDANSAFHDVILTAARVPMLERMAQSARRIFRGQIVWVRNPAIEQLYAENLSQHHALRVALEARSSAGARALATDHVLSSFDLLETVLNDVGSPAGFALDSGDPAA